MVKKDSSKNSSFVLYDVLIAFLLITIFIFFFINLINLEQSIKINNQNYLRKLEEIKKQNSEGEIIVGNCYEVEKNKKKICF